MNYITSNGVDYDYDLSPQGAHFILLPKKNTTKQMIAEAKKELRRDRDVLSIRIIPFDKFNS